MGHHALSGTTVIMVKVVAKASQIEDEGATLKVNIHLKVNTHLKVTIHLRVHLKVNLHHKVNFHTKHKFRVKDTQIKVKAKVATQVSKDLMWDHQGRSPDVSYVVLWGVIRTFVCRTHHVDLCEVVIRAGR